MEVAGPRGVPGLWQLQRVAAPSLLMLHQNPASTRPVLWLVPWSPVRCPLFTKASGAPLLHGVTTAGSLHRAHPEPRAASCACRQGAWGQCSPARPVSTGGEVACAPRAPRNHGAEWPCTSHCQRRLQCLRKTPELQCSFSHVPGRNVSSLQMIRICSLSLLRLKPKHTVKGKGSVSTLNWADVV